jgi:hypothetical protein
MSLSSLIELVGGRNKRRMASFEFRIKVIAPKNDPVRNNLGRET